ncbi:MAG: hypothetical protein IT177_19680 [Acidobacteria bacterium]|nr:hypothetical protein [Acidobacteriota bacterium]
MTRPIRLTILGLLLVLAVLAAVTPWLLPPPAAATPAPHWQPQGPIIRGAYHIHSTASDGTGGLDEIAAAAARAGLQFVIVTDHGDATRVPTPPRYRFGVLCIEAVEINTSDGHLVALGAAPSAYPLAGTGRAVLEDVHRLGGAGVAAHPGSPRDSLKWTAWDLQLDGLEWLNADSEWRDELLASLGRLLVAGALRPAETLASILDRPEAVMDRWDAATRHARVVGLAGADAHARLGFRQQTEPYEGWHVKVPSYEASFRAFALRVPLDAPLSGDPVRDAENITMRLRGGRTFTIVDGLATPGLFEFTATSAGRTARMGDYLDVVGEVMLHVRMAAPQGARMVVLKDGVSLFDTTDPETHLGVTTEPAVYRVEIHTPGATGHPPIPWLVSNPIYVGLRDVHERARATPRRPEIRGRTALDVGAWVSETSSGSESTLDAAAPADGEMAWSWRFELARGVPAGQYAALRLPLAGLEGHDRIEWRARADGPMRAWLQVRTPGGERWGRTVYLGDTFRTEEVFFDELQPIGVTSMAAPPLGAIDAVLLVVDTLNTRPGTGGRVQIAGMSLGQ